MTHLSLFLFFDVDLSPEKVVYYYQNTLSFVNKKHSKNGGKRYFLVKYDLETCCVAYQYKKIRFLILP